MHIMAATKIIDINMGYENMSCEGFTRQIYDNDLRQIPLHPGYAYLSLWGDLGDHSKFPVGGQLV